MQELFKNPIVIGLIAAILTYAYLYYDNQQKQQKYPKSEVEPISIMTPVIVGLLVFVISYNLIGKSEQLSIPQQTLPQQNDYITASPVINNKPKLLEPTVDSATFHMVGKNAIRLPQNEIFIDLAKF
jgi:hypothetical protein